MPSTSTSASNESTWRPYALRSTPMSITPNSGSPPMHSLGQHDHAGARAEDGHAAGDALANRLDQVVGPGELAHRGRLAARDHQAIDVGEILGVAHLDRGRAGVGEHAACSRKSPCSARTPAFTSVTPAPRLPAAILQPRLERADLEPGHRVAEAVRELREHVGVLEVRRRLDDRARHRAPDPRS